MDERRKREERERGRGKKANLVSSFPFFFSVSKKCSRLRRPHCRSRGKEAPRRSPERALPCVAGILARGIALKLPTESARDGIDSRLCRLLRSLLLRRRRQPPPRTTTTRTNNLSAETPNSSAPCSPRPSSRKTTPSPPGSNLSSKQLTQRSSCVSASKRP